jgi:hypothetical protein
MVPLPVATRRVTAPVVGVHVTVVAPCARKVKLWSGGDPLVSVKIYVMFVFCGEQLLHMEATMDCVKDAGVAPIAGVMGPGLTKVRPSTVPFARQVSDAGKAQRAETNPWQLQLGIGKMLHCCGKLTGGHSTSGGGVIGGRG